MLKLNKLLYLSGEAQVFTDEIEPTKKQREFLSICKNQIRDHLRPRIKAATVRVLGMPHAVEPRFRTQGSWSYRTCVQPAHQPPQEMDWDYGVYLPTEVWEENGPPKLMAKAYFTLVEGLLAELCEKNKWKLVSGKNTCIRVQVASWAHIDIPLYAAPAEKFVQIIEKVAALESHRHITADSQSLSESADFAEMPEQEWEELDDIVMATRTGEWKPSDPEAVSRWFSDRIAECGSSGDQLRRVCRYLKAWRDYHWSDGGPSSVSIMVAVAQQFEGQAGRDDLALEKAAQRLAAAIATDLYVPGIDSGAEDFNRLSPEDRVIAAAKAQALSASISTAMALNVILKQSAVNELRAQLGDRIPNRADLIEVDNKEEAIRATPAQRVASPIVRSTSAG